MLHEHECFNIKLGDCIPGMQEMLPESIDFSVFSPPFPAIFAYTSSEADIGNSEDLRGEARIHLSYVYRGLRRLIKPGRVAVVHVMQIPRLKRTGEAGMFDFRGFNIRLLQRAGFIYCYDWLVSKNPQTEAIRTRSHALQFASMARDRTSMHGQMGDYLIVVRAPGDNKVPVNSSDQITRQEWIDWAESAWPWAGPAAIRQSYTLNVKEGKGEDDTKHICPLQLDIIDRLIRLYSNPGELVYTPFAGIGSEMYTALRLGRRAQGHELKDEYFRAAIRNCERALRERDTATQECLPGLAG